MKRKKVDIPFYSDVFLLYDGCIPKDKKEAAIYYKKLADNGDVEAIHNNALILYNGHGFPFYKKEAARYFKMSADKGKVIAKFNYASMLFKGDVDSIYHNALMLKNSDGIPVNKEEAAKYFKM